MKLKLSFLTGVTSMAALVAGAFAVDSATTDPVGYITAPIVSKNVGTASKISFVSPSLVQKPEFSGLTTNAGGSASLSVSGGLTPGAWTGAYYVEIASGPQEGFWTTIVSNTANTIVTKDAIPADVAVGARIVVRKHNTISSVFGSPPVIKTGASIAAADEVQLFDGATQLPKSYYYLADPDPQFAGWYDGLDNPAADTVIEPQQGIAVKHKDVDVTPINVVIVGHVKTGKTQVEIFKGQNFTQVTLATSVTLANSNLYTGIPGSGISGGASIASADEVIILDATGTPKSYYYLADPDPQFAGWYDGLDNPAGDVLLEGGKGIKIKRKQNTDTVWLAPAQVISAN